jgi:hypothetical protein
MARKTRPKSRSSEVTRRSPKGNSPARGGNRKPQSDGRSASQKTEKYRFAQNVEGEGTAAEREYRGYALSSMEETGQDPDVLLAVPVVKVDKIDLEVDDLQAHVALKAKVLDLVNLSVGVDVHLGKLKVDIEGVEAQALLKVRLDHVAAIVDRVLTTIDRNPELVESLGRAVEDVGHGAGHTLGETGEAIEDVGEGAEGAVGGIGEGAGQAVGQVGQGVGQGVGELGEGAGQAVDQIGEGAGQAVGNVDQLAGGLGQTVGQVGQGAGEAVGGLGEGAGEAAGGLGQAVGGVGDTVGQLGQGAGQLTEGAGGSGGDGGGGGPAAGGANGPAAPNLAKEAAKAVAKEIGNAATDEAKDLGLAATRKVKELGDRRRQRRLEKHHATEAAMRQASELGVDLDEIEGTGADGRITVRDVQEASEE